MRSNVAAFSRCACLLLLVGSLQALAACRDESAVAPVARETHTEVSCVSNCTILGTLSMLRDAIANPDSTNHPVFLADVQLAGVRGDRVELTLFADDAVLDAVGPNEHVLVQTDSVMRSFPIAELRDGRVVYTFDQADTVRLRYFLDRRVQTAPSSGRLELSQHLQGSARLLGQRLAFAKPGIAESLNAPGFGCYVTGQVTKVCGNVVTLSPYAVAEHFGATFQSNPGNGQSFGISVTFKLPVKSVTVKIYDSDYPGNKMIAYDSLGNVLDSATFDYDSLPQNGAINQEKTITSQVGIARVELIAADGDYVAYDLVFLNLYCTALDSVLDDLNSRQQMVSEIQTLISEGLERAGWVYKSLTDGSYLWDFIDEGRTVCSSNTLVNAPPLQGYVAVAPWHTHPLSPGTPMPMSCPQWTGPLDKVGRGPGVYDKVAIGKVNGANTMYIVDSTTVFQLKKNLQVPRTIWLNNPNGCKWL